MDSFSSSGNNRRIIEMTAILMSKLLSFPLRVQYFFLHPIKNGSNQSMLWWSQPRKLYYKLNYHVQLYMLLPQKALFYQQYKSTIGLTSFIRYIRIQAPSPGLTSAAIRYTLARRSGAEVTEQNWEAGGRQDLTAFLEGGSEKISAHSLLVQSDGCYLGR